MRYQQLTEGQRYQISALLEEGISVKNIANVVKCHRATIYRERKRHSVNGHYCPKYAHSQAQHKRKVASKYSIPSERIAFVCLLLEHDWSPEQISNVLTAPGAPVSHEWIYQYIADDKRKKGKLYLHLRQGRKRYRKGKRVKSEVIKNTVSIDDRPAVVDSRERFGDWEIDTVLGKHGTGAIVTVLERKTRFYVAKRANSKSAADVTQATIELLRPYKANLLTITADNGREFANHEEIAKELDTKIYFAYPYSSWERGANEDANGLLRQYIPKGTDLRLVTDDDSEFAISRINYLLKKCLGFKQPAVIFNKMRSAA